MTRRLAARVDANHAAIVRLARSVGIAVADTSALGNGFPDLIFAIGNVNVLVELKDGAKVPSKRRLTPAEADFHDSWPGPIEIVETEADVLTIREKYLGVDYDPTRPARR